MTVLLALFGGMALLLYGIRQSGEALQRAAGGRLRHLLTGLVRNRLTAVFGRGRHRPRVGEVRCGGHDQKRV